MSPIENYIERVASHDTSESGSSMLSEPDHTATVVQFPKLPFIESKKCSPDSPMTQEKTAMEMENEKLLAKLQVQSKQIDDCKRIINSHLLFRFRN